MPDRFLDVNPAACELYQYTREEFLQLYPTEIDDPSIMEKRSEIQRELREKGCATFESYHTTKHRQVFPVDVNTSVFMHNGQRMAVSIIRDISRRKAAEDALRESEIQYRTLAENLPGIVYREFYRDERHIEFYNDMLTVLTGYTLDDLREGNICSLYRYLHPDDKERVPACIQNAISEQKLFETEYRLRRKDGVYIDVIERGRPVFSEDGQLQYVDGIISDISRRKKTEQALNEANKKLNILSSITRHDVLNQLSVATTYLELLNMEGMIPPGSEMEKTLRVVSQSLETIERLTVFTRDYQDLGQQAPRWYDVQKIVASSTRGVSVQGPVIENTISGLEVFADPLFEKVIFNLVDNAVRHGKTLKSIRFSSEKTAGGLILVCEDDGVGVPVDLKEKIFNRQYYQNTGLGLYLSQEILSITGMSITETGTPGKGARFEILVPDGMWRSV